MPKATVTLVKDMQFLVELGSGHTLTLDSKVESGGHGSSPRPFELMAASVAGCTAMDVISILRKMRERVTDLQVQVVGAQAEEYPKRFTGIEVTYILTGFNLDEKKVQQAIMLSETKYCPAMASLRPGTPIASEYIIKEASEESIIK